jgi:hypothetical protein
MTARAMPEQDPRDKEPTTPESGVPATPRVSGEVAARPASASAPPEPVSDTRAAVLPEEPPAVSEPGDTLLSAGKPAARLEVMVEDRFAVLDERLHQLEARLVVLEQKKSTRAPEPQQKPWLWIAFLIALVVVFQLLRLAR